MPRRHAAVDLARPGRANGHPADQVTRKRLELSRTMWAVEHELQEPSAEGRAIDPAAVERMFDATRGAHISPGEFEHIWRGQSGPPADRAWPDPAGPWYCTGIDWAQKCDSTVAAVVRCETTPLQLVAVYRAQRRLETRVHALQAQCEPPGRALPASRKPSPKSKRQDNTPSFEIRSPLFTLCGGATSPHCRASVPTARSG